MGAKKRFKIKQLFFACIFLLLCMHSINSQDKPYVVMLSLDGFRWDYADKASTPNLDRIAENGVKLTSLKPSFPTKTFPNHYTIVTGLYPDNHGIVANKFYDPDIDRHYKVSDRKAVRDGSFYGGEPVWVTAEKQGMRSASYFWIGSEADVNGIYPSYWKTYDHHFPFTQTIDSVVYWLQLPEEQRPHLVLFYNPEPDGVGHQYGPDSKEVKDMIVLLDSLVGVAYDKITALPIADQVNFIIVSDHGMTEIQNKHVINLSDHIHEKWFEHIEGSSPVFSFTPKEKYRDVAFKALQEIEHARVWQTKNIPEELHYGTNPRTLEWILLADSGRYINQKKIFPVPEGDHGYDNDFKDMHGIFYAAGPAFKKNYISSCFENTEIYNLICYILNLEPASNDGDIEKIKDILNQ